MTILLAIKPATSPSTIQAINDMVSVSRVPIKDSKVVNSDQTDSLMSGEGEPRWRLAAIAPSRGRFEALLGR